jgi:hypothetical protein
MTTMRYHIGLCAIAACVVLTSGFTVAQDGVVRISDRNSQAVAAQPSTGIQTTSFQGGSCTVGDGCCVTEPTCVSPVECAEGCCTVGCGNPKCKNDCCMCQNCCCNGRMQCGVMEGTCCGVNCLFAGSQCSGTGCKTCDFWRGQSLSFRAKNARLADCLFGWMCPSGCCGKGCPPVGGYKMTYADQPQYYDARDNQMYAAQGYGMPMTVPLAPTVNYSYNYSSGMPSSRITPISDYNPQTSPQPLFHKSW